MKYLVGEDIVRGKAVPLIFLCDVGFPSVDFFSQIRKFVKIFLTRSRKKSVIDEVSNYSLFK